MRTGTIGFHHSAWSRCQLGLQLCHAMRDRRSMLFFAEDIHGLRPRSRRLALGADNHVPCAAILVTRVSSSDFSSVDMRDTGTPLR